MDTPRGLLKTALFTVLVPGTVAGAIPQWLARRDQLQLPLCSSLGRLVGGAFVVSGLLLYLHTARQFAFEGHGTPPPSDEPVDLVTGGMYEYVRNPMYLGVLLIVASQVLWYRPVSVLWWAAGCWFGFHNRVLEYEEPHLVEKYGESYVRYLDRVPRWRPRLRPPDRDSDPSAGSRPGSRPPKMIATADPELERCQSGEARFGGNRPGR